MERQLDIERRLTETIDREKSNTRRIEKLEKGFEVIYDLSKTMARLVEQIKTTNEKVNSTNESVQKLESKVDAIQSEPAEAHKQLKKTITTSIVTAIIGAIIGALLSLIFK